MPLILSPGSVTEWLDAEASKRTPPEVSYTGTEGLRPNWVTKLADKVINAKDGSLAPNKITRQRIVEILNLYASSNQSEAARRELHRVHYRNNQPISNWEDLANFILHANATESNRLKEIELSMIVAKSPLVLSTINMTIQGIEKMMLAIRLSRGASLTRADYNETILNAQQGSREHKTYLPWILHKTINSALGDSSAGFTVRMALLHDLMEFSVLMFKSDAVRRVFGFEATPMTYEETVTVNDGVWKIRDRESECQSIQYAKSLHCPVECGPSYTTTRLLRLPDTISRLTSNELAEASKRAQAPAQNNLGVKGGPTPPIPVHSGKEPADPIKRMAAVKVVPHPEGYLLLNPEQKAHIAWGILSWWTLNFPKHWPRGAHCFFEVSDAARSCGVQMAKNPGAYPTAKELCERLKVEWTVKDAQQLEKRRRALIAGLEQGHIPGLDQGHI